MNELTNVGLSAISKTHEDVMRGLFNLTIRPPKKIEISQIKSYYPLGTVDGISYRVYPR